MVFSKKTVYFETLEFYENKKIYMKLQQKLLFKKYIAILKEYEETIQEYDLFFKIDLLNDDALIELIAPHLSRIILYCHDEEYINDLDKGKYNKAKELTSREILRIKSLINSIKKEGVYYESKYNREEFKNILEDYLSEDMLNDVLNKFFKNYKYLDDEHKIIQFPGGIK